MRTPSSGRSTPSRSPSSRGLDLKQLSDFRSPSSSSLQRSNSARITRLPSSRDFSPSATSPSERNEFSKSPSSRDVSRVKSSKKSTGVPRQSSSKVPYARRTSSGDSSTTKGQEFGKGSPDDMSGLESGFESRFTLHEHSASSDSYSSNEESEGFLFDDIHLNGQGLRNSESKTSLPTASDHNSKASADAFDEDSAYSRVSQDSFSIDDDDLDTTQVWSTKYNLEVVQLFRGHRNPVSCVALSHDDECLLSCCVDESIVKLWNISDIAVTQELDRHTSGVTCVTFSKDDKYALSGSRGGGVIVWPIKPVMGTEVVLEGQHTNAVTAVTMIYDNEVVISASEDKTILVWELKSGTVIRSLVGHTKGVTSLGFVQTPVQHLLLSGSKDRTIILWDIMEGTSIQTYDAHSRTINCIAVSNNYELFASAGKESLIKVHNFKSNELQSSYDGHNGAILSLAFSYDDKVLLSAGDDERIILWNVETREIIRDVHSGGGIVSSICASLHNTMIYFACQDCTIRRLHVNTEKALEVFDSCKYKVTCVVISACKKKMLTGSDDCLVRVWDMATRDLLYILKGHSRQITAIAISTDNKLIVSGSKDKTIRLWTVKKGMFVSKVLKGHNSPVTCLTLTADRQEVYSGSTWSRRRSSKSSLEDASLIAWDVSTGEMTVPVRGAHPQGVTCIASATEFNVLITGSRDGKLRVMDLSRDINEHNVFTIDAHSQMVTCVAIARGTRRVVSGSLDGLVKLWDGQTGEFHRVFEHQSGVSCLAICSNSTFDIVSGCLNGSVLMWHGTTGEVIRCLETFLGPIHSIDFSDDGDAVVYSSDAQSLKHWFRKTSQTVRFTLGRRSCEIMGPEGAIIPGGDERTVKIYQKNTPLCSFLLEGHTDTVLAVDISVDNSRILSGGQDGKLILWDRKKGSIIRSMSGHRDSVNCVAISENNNFLVSGGSDCKVIIWNANTGYLLFHLEGHKDTVTSVAISKDCSTIVSGSTDKTIALWSMLSGTLMLTLDEPPTIAVEYAMEDVKLRGKAARKAVTKWNSAINKRVTVIQVPHGIITSVCVSSDNSFVCAGSDNKLVIKWDIMGKILLLFPGHSGPVNAVSLSVDTQILVSGSDDRTVRVWNSANAKVLRVLTGHKGSVSAVSITSDNKNIASASMDPIEPYIILWSLDDGKILRMFEHSGGVSDMRISLDGEVIVSGGRNKKVNIEENVLSQPHLLYALEVFNRPGGLNHLKELFVMFPGLLYEHWQNKNILLSLLEKDNVEFFSEVVTIAPLSIFATLISQDGSPKNILGCAIEMKADKCIQVMLEVYTELLTEYQEDLNLSHDYIPDDSKYIPYNPELASYPYYPLVDIVHLIQIAHLAKFRTIFVDFIKILKCVRTDNSILLGSSRRGLLPRGRIIAGSESLHCDKFWEQYVSNDDSAPAIEAFVVPLKNIASLNSNFLQDIVDVAEKERRFDIFTSEIIDILLTFKWDTFVRPMFVKDLRIHLMYIIVFWINAIYMAKHPNDHHPVIIILYVVLIGLFSYIFKNSFFHALQAVLSPGGMWKYFLTARNFLGLLSLLGVFLTIGLEFGIYVDSDSDSSALLSAHNGCAALTSPLLVIDILFFFKSLKHKGYLARMVFKMIDGTKSFFALLCLGVLGFAASMNITFNDSPNYSTFERSIMSVFGFLLGNYNIDEINESSIPFIANVLLLVFLLYVSIMSLNLMIALMGDKYDEVTNTSRAEGSYALARLILRYERIIPMSEKTKNESTWYPVWLQVARNNTSNSFVNGSYEWTGRIQRIEDCIAHNTALLKQHTKKTFEPSGTVISTLSSSIEDLQREQRQLKEDIQHVILLLAQNKKKLDDEDAMTFSSSAP